ncbi:hypothetical protein A2U01_0069053, partial [Trifolium medium]|nr:hypothetical protein [Trifolium medium]
DRSMVSSPASVNGLPSG